MRASGGARRQGPDEGQGWPDGAKGQGPDWGAGTFPHTTYTGGNKTFNQ